MEEPPHQAETLAETPQPQGTDQNGAPPVLIKLESSDEQIFTVPQHIAEMSITIKHMLDDIKDDSDLQQQPIPLPNVTGVTLQKAIDYCTYHHEHPDPKSMDTDTKCGCECDEEEEKELKKHINEEMCEWDKEFCDIDQDQLFELILCANYLDIKRLLDVTCKAVANQMKGKTPEELRELFGIENDFTPEEYEEAKRENEWLSEH